MSSNSKNDQIDDALKTEMIARCWELRLTGMSTRAIARELNIKSHSTVAEYLKIAQSQRLEESVATANEYRIAEIERLDSLQDKLLNELLKSLTEDDPKSVQVKANIIDKCIKITQERSKLLGLYAPVEVKSDVEQVVKVDVSSLSDAELKEKFAELFR